MRDDAVDLVFLVSQLKADIEEQNFDSSLATSRLIEDKLRKVDFTELDEGEIQAYKDVYFLYTEFVKILNKKKVEMQSQFSETVMARKAINIYKSI